MAETRTRTQLRRLAPADLSAYKTLRDESLLQHPDAFDSDYDTERLRQPESYLGRLGLGEPLGGTFLFGAWDDGKLIGCIASERSTIGKTRHRAEFYGLYVRDSFVRHGIGGDLLSAAIEEARKAAGLRMVTATITASSLPVMRLYERAGFTRYGLLPRAVRVATHRSEEFFDKAEMVLML